MHDLWHEVQLAYADADDFVLKLNACIQAARSVTWVLQQEGARHEQFQDWYSPRQARMRADRRMRWLVEARNAIEKRGDLDTHSVASVSVALTDGEYAMAEVDVPPLLSPEAAARMIKLDELPQRVRRQAVMVVERRWTVPELPSEELLDTLAHCYGVLATVVREAHEFLGVEMQTFGGERHGGRHERGVHPSGRLPCMVATAEERTAYWHLGADTLLELEEQAESLTPTDLADIAEEAERRYGDIGRRHKLLPGTSLHARAATTHQIARRVLTADGHHSTIAWIYRDGMPLDQYGMDSTDQPEKIVKMRRLASEVARGGADALILVAESWIAPEVSRDDPRFDQRAGERGDRAEVLTTYLLQREGPHRQWFTHFGRDKDQSIVLAQEEEHAMGRVPLFDPVLKVWESWKRPVG